MRNIFRPMLDVMKIGKITIIAEEKPGPTPVRIHKDFSYHSSMIRISAAGLIGLLQYASIPKSKHFCTSSLVAFAVNAMIGITRERSHVFAGSENTTYPFP